MLFSHVSIFSFVHTVYKHSPTACNHLILTETRHGGMQGSKITHNRTNDTAESGDISNRVLHNIA